MIEFKVFLEEEDLKLLINWNHLPKMEKEVLDEKVYGQLFNAYNNRLYEEIGR